VTRVLITGAGGYVGQYLARDLANFGYEVTATYRDKHSFLENVRWVRCDLKGELDILPTVDYVIHSATVHPLVRPTPNVVDFLDFNVNATHRLAQWSKETRVKKFILLSTITVLGEITATEVTEELLPRSPNLYGITKYLAERVLETFSNDYVVCILRLPGVAGPRIVSLGRPWISSLLSNAMMNEPINIYNCDALYNNVIDVDAISKACAAVLRSFETNIGLFNLAGREPVPMRTVVQYIIDTLTSDSKIIEVQSDRPSFHINTDRIASDLGFRPLQYVSTFVT
jgi:UDP-glucose 4-epimerase